MSDTVVRYEVTDRVGVITIDRPDKKNAMSTAVFDQLGERAREAAADPACGAVLVQGAGGNFSSGIDLTVFAEQSAGGGISEDFIVRLQDSFNAFEDIAKPVVAYIEGYCFGGGIQLALACHLRMTHPDAVISVLETRWGIVPDLGGTQRLARLVGAGRALELAITARRISGKEALDLGVCELEATSTDEAFDYVARLAKGPAAVRRLPKLVRDNFAVSRDEAQANERAVQLLNLTGHDFKEAVTAFLEKRDPEFTGE